MQRHAHYLKKTTGNAFPAQTICVDTWLKPYEKPVSQGLDYGQFEMAYCWRWKGDGEAGLAHCRNFCTKPADLMQWILRFAHKGTVTWLFAFDLLPQLHAWGFWDDVELGIIELVNDDPWAQPPPGEKRARRWRGYCVLENPPNIVVCRGRNKGGTIRMVDLRNYGLEFLTDSEPGKPAPSVNGYGAVDWDVIKRDQTWDRCWRVGCFVQRMVSTLKACDWGSLQATSGSQAMYSYRHKYMVDKLLVHEDQEILELERASYYGGRCEARYVGKVAPVMVENLEIMAGEITQNTWKRTGPIHHLDFNSLYPYCAANAAMPGVLAGPLLGISIAGLTDLCNKMVNIATVDIVTPTPLYPVRQGEITIWPTGRFRTTLAGAELAFALQARHVIRLGDVVSYYPCSPFADWAEETYAMRLAFKAEGHKACASWVKSMLVALPGKLGQRSRRWVDAPEVAATSPYATWWQPDKKTGQLERYRSIGWAVQKMIDAGEHAESLPAVAACITAAARVRLAAVITCAGWNNVYYCDTDGIFVNTDGAGALAAAGWISDSELGLLSLRAVYKEVEIMGIKHYKADGQLVCAGLPASAHKGDDGVYRYVTTEALPLALSRGHVPGGLAEIKSHTPDKVYRHGVVQPSGWVRPYVIEGGCIK